MSHSDNSDKGSKYRKRGRNFAWSRRFRTKQARHQAKHRLEQGTEPPPYRHRHGALWDWF